MLSRCKTFNLSAAVWLMFAIAVAIASATASAQGPATSSQGASVAPTSAAAPSVAVTAAPQPAAAVSPASVNAAAAALSPDAHTVIAYLSDVINWYGHLGVEAQLVRDPDETLVFADDRQTAGEILKLAFEYARAQAAFIAKSNPGAAPAAGPAGTVSAESNNITHNAATLDAAANALRARITNLQAQLAKAPARQRNAIALQIQDAQSQLDLNQARGDALKALAQFESGSSSPDQSGGLAAQIDELEHSIADSSKKTTTPPADIALVASAQPTGILSLITELFALSNKLDALEQNAALARALAARATEVRKSILAVIAGLNARGDTLAQEPAPPTSRLCRIARNRSKACSKRTNSPAPPRCRSASRSCCSAFTPITSAAGTTQSSSAAARNSAASSFG